MSWDTIIWVFAGFDILCLVGLGIVALQFKRQAGEMAEVLRPAIKHATGTAKLGQRLATSTSGSVRAITDNCNQLIALVRRRVETTRRIAGELRPPAREETQALAQEVGRKVTLSKDWAGRVRRLHKAGSQAAGRSNRRTDGAKSP